MWSEGNNIPWIAYIIFDVLFIFFYEEYIIFDYVIYLD